jgi:tetratricopeptide (TPR) repeat protein
VPPRIALYVNVAIAAIAAAGLAVGLTLDTRTTPHQAKPFPGKPPVPTNLPAPYGPMIEAAFRDWPHGSIDTMQKLGLEYGNDTSPRRARAIVAFYRGFALLWAGYPGDAETALENAKKLGRNTPIQGEADNLLHPGYFQPTSGASYPVFIPTRPNKLLSRGSELQAEGHQESAEALYARAARLAPNDDEAQVAKAVGLFDEDNLTPAFSHLGPLVARFPKSQSVHYYLGLLLAWTSQGSLAITQFEDTVKLGPTTQIGKAATRFLDGIKQAGTTPASG